MSNYKKLATFGEKKEEKSDNIPQILKIEDKNFILQNYKICVIDVYADWCGPCKIVSPPFSKLFAKYNIPGVCILAKENVDLKLSPNIQVVPSFQFFFYGNLDSQLNFYTNYTTTFFSTTNTSANSSSNATTISISSSSSNNWGVVCCCSYCSNTKRGISTCS